MFASFKYRLSREEYVVGIRLTSLSLASQDRWRTIRCLIPFAIVGLAATVAIYFNPASLDGIVLTLALIWFPYLYMQMRWVRRWREMAFNPAIADLAVTLDEGGVIEQNDLARGQWSWDGVRRIHDVPEAVVLEVTDWHAITLPARLWTIAEERAEFVALVRERATSALPDLPTVNSLRGPTLLLLLGSVAFGLDLMIATETGLSFADFYNCSCAFRRSFHGQLMVIVPFVAYFAAFAVAWIGLKRLSRGWPRTAVSIAILFIFAFVASQAIPPLLQIYRFFSLPAR